jgi:YedE family putative selenium metabolism protein
VSAVVATFIGALVFNLILGQFHLGFSSQPISHTSHLWNFLGMALVGLGATLLGGCPLRQAILSGEGDTDAAVTVLGLIVGAAFAHNFLTSASAKGIGDHTVIAVVLGLVFCLGVGLFMREKTA